MHHIKVSFETLSFLNYVIAVEVKMEHVTIVKFDFKEDEIKVSLTF